MITNSGEMLPSTILLLYCKVFLVLVLDIVIFAFFLGFHFSNFSAPVKPIFKLSLLDAHQN